MPAILRKSFPTALDSRKEILHAISWQVRSSAWSPPTDVYETGESFVVRVEIAGMRDEDFELGVENNVLVIAGIRPDITQRRAYHQMEIWFGKFEIAIDVPIPVDVSNSAAEYKEGFLTVNLPKAQPKQTRVEG